MMAGRGRGRGKTVSFDVQALGFGRGDALPAATVQPPPLFPVSGCVCSYKFQLLKMNPTVRMSARAYGSIQR